jgi:AcrR family transcriptional regulator
MSTSGSAGAGLRERKKRRTRQAIQQHALRLFAEQGYEATTVEQIAAAAEVSPSTFFRYYPTKEDVVLDDGYDPIFYRALLEQPAGEAPLVALHGAMRSAISGITADDGREMRERLRLVLSVPALRGRVIQNTGQSVTLVAEALARRAGRTKPGYEDESVAGGYMGMAVVAVMRWAERGGDPADLLERGYAALRAGFGS